MNQRRRDSHLSGLKAFPNRLRRPLVASLAVVVIALVIIELAISNSNPPTTAASSDAQETWQRWDMSIQHPSRLPTYYLGFEEPNATSNSGIVQWVWNHDATSLTLTWANATQSGIRSGLPGAEDIQRGTELTNVVLGDGGNIAMGESVWAYQTYRGMMHGATAYAAVATSYYSASHRVYVLILVDRNPASLATLLSYGKTFHG